MKEKRNKKKRRKLRKLRDVKGWYLRDCARQFGCPVDKLDALARDSVNMLVDLVRAGRESDCQMDCQVTVDDKIVARIRDI